MLNVQNIQVAISAAVALAMLFQAFVLFALFLAMRKGMRDLTDKLDQTRSSILPVVEKTRVLLDTLSPKLIDATTDIAALSKSLRTQTDEVQTAAAEIITRVRGQVARIDSLLSSTLDAVDRATGFMTDSVAKPMRQVSALLVSIKAAIESLRTYEAPPRAHQHGDPNDPDMFI